MPSSIKCKVPLSFYSPYTGPSTELQLWLHKFIHHPLLFPASQASPWGKYIWSYELVSISHMPLRKPDQIHGVWFPIVKMYASVIAVLRAVKRIHLLSCTAYKMDHWNQGKGHPVNYFDMGIFLRICCNALYLNDLLQQWQG